MRFTEGNTIGPNIDPSARVGRDCYIDPSATVEAGAHLGKRVRLAAWSTVEENAHVDPDTLVDRGATIGESAQVVNTTPETGGHIPAYAVIPARETIELQNGVVRDPKLLTFRDPADIPHGGEPVRRGDFGPSATSRGGLCAAPRRRSEGAPQMD